MKLYSIWWEEEIPLMCSCNDCSKKGKKEGKEKCLPEFESLERNQSFESTFFCILQSPSPPQPTPRHSNSSELSHIAAGSLTLTLEISNRFDTGRPAVSEPSVKQRLRWRRRKLDVWRKHLHKCEIWEKMLQAALVFTSQRNTFNKLFGQG